VALDPKPLEVGSGNAHTTLSDWQPAGTGWERTLIYPSGKTIARGGRLAFLDIDGAGTRSVDFLWSGELYEGRRHEWSANGTIDPIQETRRLDGFVPGRIEGP